MWQALSATPKLQRSKFGLNELLGRSMRRDCRPRKSWMWPKPGQPRRAAATCQRQTHRSHGRIERGMAASSLSRPKPQCLDTDPNRAGGMCPKNKMLDRAASNTLRDGHPCNAFGRPNA